MLALEVSGLTKTFGAIKAVNNLNFTVNQGDVFGILGTNGSGKSTTLRLILNLVNADSGLIRLYGSSLSLKNSRQRMKLGALIERPDFYEYLTAYKNLEILLKYSRIRPAADIITDALRIVGLEKVKDKKVGTFSQGMKQRLGIAQAIMHKPELIILDEPLNGLDPHGIVDTRNLIQRLNKEQGMTIIVSSHMLRELELTANRMLIINEGKALAEGNVQDLLARNHAKFRFKVSDNERAFLAMKSLELDNIVNTNDGEFVCWLKLSDVPKVNRLLVQQHIKVYAIIPEFNLEEYFISLV